MRKLLLVAVLLPSWIICRAQTDVRSALDSLAKTTNDTQRVNLWLKVCELSNDDSFWPVYNDSVLSLTEIKLRTARGPLFRFYKMSKGTALNNRAYLLMNKGANPEAIREFSKALDIFRELDYRYGVAITLENIGSCWDNLGQPDKALDYYRRAYSLAAAANDLRSMAILLNNIGTLYDHRGDVKSALENYQKSIDLKEKAGIRDGLDNVLNNIGCIYDVQGNFLKAEEYFKKSLAVAMETRHKEGMANAQRNLGKMYLNQGSPEKALPMLRKSLKINTEIENFQGTASTLCKLGDVFERQGDLDSAFFYYHKALLLSAGKGEKAIEAESLLSMARLDKKRGKERDALQKALKSFDLSRELGFPESMRTSAELLYQLNKSSGNNDKALYYHEIFTTMHDSLRNSRAQRETMQKQMQYEFEKKEALSRVEMEKKELEAAETNRRQQTILAGVFLVLLVVGGFSFLLQKRLREIRKQKSLIEEQKAEIEMQKHLVEEKSKEVTDSIVYARRIQKALLSSEEALKENFSDHFILYKPRDIVSGDFFWSHRKGNKFWLAVADCTGHGVPGAFMSLLGISFLNELVGEQNLNSPDIVLNELREKIVRSLNPHGSAEQSRDGMDIILTCFDIDAGTVAFSMANNPLWLIRGREGQKEITAFTPDKMPVGKYVGNEGKFSLHSIDIHQGDEFIFITDGYADQFGGPPGDKRPGGKKFRYKALQHHILSVCEGPLSAQGHHLEKTMESWMEGYEQIDDITVLGIRI